MVAPSPEFTSDDDRDQLSIGGALLQLTYQISAAMAICFSSLAATDRLASSGSLLEGLRAGWWMDSSFGFAIPVIALVFLRHVKLASDVGKSEALDSTEVSPALGVTLESAGESVKSDKE